jgi:hypothetical protein
MIRNLLLFPNLPREGYGYSSNYQEDAVIEYENIKACKIV